ncbi:MAG: succinyl-diaminopimelate desuccinylase [Rickettsiales bacterium]|nr:succinyl-diaminopimelate desuccinylase [Rickettsiales bacterium]
MQLTSPLPLAQALIAEPSVTPLSAGCFQLLQSWLESLGFTVWRRVFEEAGHAATENLYARRAGLGGHGANLCFAGHIDVVPPGDAQAWKYPPFSPTLASGFLYGRGAEDMKGAIASMIAGVARAIESSPDNLPTLSFLLTADEEGDAVNGTEKALRWVVNELGETLDYCLVGEPTNPTFLGEMAKIGRRGSLLASLRVQGRQGHVAYPHLADNPITTLVAMLHTLKTTTLDAGNAWFPPSNLEVTSIEAVNATHNLIPASAQAYFNIRFNDHYTGAQIQDWVRERCDSVSHPYELNMRVSGESFLSPPGKLSDALVQAVKKVTDHTPQLSTTGGTSDARFIRHYCPVIEFGTTGFTPHQINERVEVAVLEQLADVYAQFIHAMTP